MEESATVIRAIGVFKMVKTVVLLGAAVFLMDVRSRGATHEALRFVERLGIDPGSHTVRVAIEKMNGMSAHKLELFAIACVVYSAVFATEGTGLLLRKHWAEWLTVVVTASFMPIEIYELVHHATAMRVAALVINALVLVYLLVRIHSRRTDRQGPDRGSPRFDPRAPKSYTP